MTYPVFPTTLPGFEQYATTRTPTASTIRQPSISGRNTFNPQWAYPLWKYEVSFDVLRSSSLAEWQQFVGFWNTVMFTPGGYFTYNDENDDTATSQQFGVGDGTTVTFQLCRALGGFIEPVLSPNSAGLVVKVNGTITSVTINPGGTVTFASAPASSAVLTWTGTFSWLCQFDDDTADFENFSFQFWKLNKMSFTTVRL